MLLPKLLNWVQVTVVAQASFSSIKQFVLACRKPPAAYDCRISSRSYPVVTTAAQERAPMARYQVDDREGRVINQSGDSSLFKLNTLGGVPHDYNKRYCFFLLL